MATRKSRTADPAHGATHSIERPLLITTIIGFAALTMVGIVVDGVPGAVVDAITFNWHSLQIYVDLVLAVAVICVWMYRDARTRNRNAWPWIIAAVVVGMFSPLVYLLVRTTDQQTD